MKTSNFLKVALLGFSMLLATTVVAENKGALHIRVGLNVGEKEIPAGEYTVEWKETGGELDLKIVKDRKVVTTAHGKWVALERVSSSDAILVRNDNGIRQLSEIRFSGKKEALQITDSSVIVRTQTKH